MSRLVTALAIFLVSMQAVAFDANKLCLKIQSCIEPEMAKQGISAEMMQPLIEGMCVGMTGQLEEGASEFEREVDVCFNAMVNANCDVLLNNVEEIKPCADLHEKYQG